MTSESSERRPREVTTSTFQEWVAQKAADRGSSRERVLKRLLDSYWTLEQIDQVLGGQRHAGTSGPDRSANDHRNPDERDANGTVTEPDDEILDTVEKLRTELEAAARRRTELAEAVQTLADRVDDAEATRRDVDELTETVEEVRSTLEADQARLHERMDDEFDNLQTVLEYLVRAGEERDTRISETVTQYGAEIRELRAERDRLRRIREDARDLGTYDADCEQCGAPVDFALLTSPTCPNCDRPLTGVEAETNWLVLTSYTATTETRATASQSPDTATDPSHDERPTAQRGDDTDATTAADGRREQSASDGTRPDERDRQMDEGETPTESTEATDDDADESAGTSPDETDFQWLS